MSYAKRFAEAKERIKDAEAALASAKDELVKVRESKFPSGKFELARGYTWRRIGDWTAFYLFHKSYGVCNVEAWDAICLKLNVYQFHKRYNMQGTITAYATLERLIAAARRHKVPEELISAFIAMHHSKSLGSNAL
jgi:hypothetical protein